MSGDDSISLANALRTHRRAQVPGGHSGSAVWRVWLNGDAGESGPPSVIVKQTRRADATQEVRFYRELGQMLMPLVPEVYAADFDAGEGLNEVVLTDLADTHFFPMMGDTWSEAQLRQIVIGYARLHSAASSLLSLPSWIPSEKATRPTAQHAAAMFDDLMSSRLARPSHNGAGQSLDAARAALLSLPPIDALIGDEPTSLLHGDCWIANIGLPRVAGAPVVFVDWELVSFGPATLDIANLLLMQPDARLRAQWPRWLDLYWQERERIDGRRYPAGWDPEVRRATALAGAIPFVGHVHRNVITPPPIDVAPLWWGELFTMLANELPGWTDLRYWTAQDG
jgi:hypothetical protein